MIKQGIQFGFYGFFEKGKLFVLNKDTHAPDLVF